jgi:hypothetical protein
MVDPLQSSTGFFIVDATDCDCDSDVARASRPLPHKSSRTLTVRRDCSIQCNCKMEGESQYKMILARPA